MFTIQRAIHTIKGGNSRCIFFFFQNYAPFFYLVFFFFLIHYQTPHSEALAPTCGALVICGHNFQTITAMYVKLYTLVEHVKKCRYHSFVPNSFCCVRRGFVKPLFLHYFLSYFPLISFTFTAFLISGAFPFLNCISNC